CAFYRRLKADLQFLRRRGLLKASGELSYQGRKCTRCGAPFGKFYNTGASCTRCRHRVCRQCRIEVRSPTDNKDVEWICNVCYKIAELHIVTGKWTYENSVSKGSINQKAPSPVEILKHSIRRAWTINGPPTRWSAARKSPELRIYRSLPSRHQEYREIINKNEIVKLLDTESSNTDEKERVATEANEQSGECNGSARNDPYKDATVRNETIIFEKCTLRYDTNERTNAKRGEKLSNKQEEDVPSSDAIKAKRNERFVATNDNKAKIEEQDESTSSQEQTTPRVSLIKPPKILTKFISPEIKSTQVKHGERKSNIPIFRRSSKEFEDIRSPQESPKRSLIPQRYRGSTDDLRRSREDISVPSLIPKLISPRSKEDRLKRQDSKDDIRCVPKTARKDSKEETRSTAFQSVAKEDSKHGIRLFRRDNSREDVGRESANSNANSAAVAAKGKQVGKEEKQERTEERVGVSSTSKSKSTVHEQGRTKVPGREGSKESRDGKSSRNDEEEPCVEQYERVRTEEAANEQTMLDVVVTDEKLLEEQEGVKKGEKEVKKEIHATEADKEEESSMVEVVEALENNKNVDSMKETAESLVENPETDVTALGTYERKDTVHGRKSDEFQVVRRKFSKEEFSNPDDTDDTPNKRCSSHLSPEASPLSTRSSRYSPRESESEPTPALPRKTADSCSASQRIRDAITRTRRESNSSARYESSGSESVRFSEIGLHGYVELARKVKFFSGNGNGTIPSTIGSDEVVQRDSATSAGEDEPHDDNHGRTGPVSSQGRSMLRRRRQFDAQVSSPCTLTSYTSHVSIYTKRAKKGSRRRGRSHARTCCAEELQGFQTLHVIGRDGRQHSPTGNQAQDQPLVDYRRLVFISSDSSSGREEDDADSSCSSSSYLNGLPRAGSHTQSLEDCDWDYFESGSLPLPIGVPVTIGTNNVGTDTSGGQDWSCCPGRGSTACQACGGSRGANVLPVPVPIPVPVPYPVPVPAALWTSDFAAAASSMISRSSDAHAEPGTLRLRGDPAAPWFAWHPRFNQPLHGTRLDPRLTGVFDPTTCTFRPDQVLAPPLYRSTIETSSIPSTEELHQRLNSLQINQDENDDAGVNVVSKSVEAFQDGAVLDISNESKIVEQSSTNVREQLDESKDVQSQENYDETNETKESEETDCQDSVSVSFESRRGQRMYQHEDSGSSSGRSSADSSDLEEDSSSHRFSRVFVVNDDSLTSDNDIEDNGDEDEDSDSAAEDSVTLKRVTALPDGEPVVLQYVRFLNEDSNFEDVNRDRTEGRGISKGNSEEEEKMRSSCKEDGSEDSDKSMSDRIGNVNEKRKTRGKRNSSETSSDKRISLSLQQREMPEEMYIASDNDCSEHQVELKSIKTLDPDSIEPVIVNNTIDTDTEQIETTFEKRLFEKIENDRSRVEERELLSQITSNNEDTNLDNQTQLLSTDAWDSNIIPDSLEISGQQILNHGNDNDEHDISTDLNSNLNVTANVSSGSDSFTSNETNATGSEVSSDELHEYEVTSANVSSHYENEFSFSTLNNSELLSKLNKRNEERTPRQSNRRDNVAESFKDNDYYNESIVTASNRTKWHTQYEKATIDQSADNTNNDGVASVCTETGCDVGDIITNKIQEMFKSAESAGKTESAHDSGLCTVRGESPPSGQVVGEYYGGGGEGGSGTDGGSGVAGGCAVEGIEGGSTRFRSVERRPSTRKENGFPPAASTKDSIRDDVQHFPPTVYNNNLGNNNSNKYRSLVMITQEASYQPVSVITSDTTTLLQPDEVHTASQGLAGYFQLALEAVSEQPHRKNGQGPRKPLMVKRLASATTNHSETEVDSGLSIGSASESDDVSVKNTAKLTGRQENNDDSVPKDYQGNEVREVTRARVSSQSSDENSASGVVVILEEGLADDDSWVEEVSHDEDEPGATTATEESSEDEANNLGDREEELRGYHRQAIDFTLHTIVEESCEESEAEPSLATGSPSKKQRPPSASELEKYFFFGLGGDGNNSSMGSREVDSLSETSSIYSEGLESLGQDETPGNGQSQERSNSGEGFLNSSRLEKYFLSEFLGFDQDRRDSDGSVGSDSEGRPSPEAQRKKKLVRARGTGRSHSSSLDNLLALTQSSQNLSLQNSLQDLSLNQDAQETQSEGSSTETDGADDGQTAAFGTDGQFDTVKRKKKKPRNLGTQSPRVPEDRNKTPEPSREMILVGEVSLTYNHRSKQQSRDSGFVGSCDDLLQHQKLPDDAQSSTEINQETAKDRSSKENSENDQNASQTSTKGMFGVEKGSIPKVDHPLNHTTLPHLANASLSRKDSFNNWSSDEETNLMMSKMRQFFKTMVANSNGQNQNTINTNSSGASPAPSPRLPGYTSKARLCPQNRTKPPQLVYFENELTRLMKTVPGIRDEQVREIVEYLSSEDTWSDSYDSSDYTSSDLEGAAGGRRSALQEQISQSCQQIISKFDTTSGDNLLDREREDKTGPTGIQAPCLGRDTAFVYQKLVQSFTKMAGDGVSSDANSTPHSSPPLIAKVMHHIGSRLVALMHEVSEGGSAVQHHTTSWRRYSQHHRTPSSASTTEDDDSTSDSTNAPSSTHLQLPRSKSHDPLLLINNHPAASTGQEGEEREASDYERFSWRGSFESALMAADSRTKLSLLACSGDSVGASASANALAMAAKRRSAGDLLFNPKSFSREQLDRVRSCGSIGGGSGGAASGCGGSVEERIWSNRRRSSVPDANTRGESGDEDTEDELEYTGESRATTLPRGMQSAITAATNSLPRLPASTAPAGLTTTSTTPSSTMHKAHSVYHFLPQHSNVKSARYRPPGFARNSNVPGAIGGPKRAVSAPGLQISGSQSSAGKRDNSRSRRQQAISLTPEGTGYSTFNAPNRSWTVGKLAQRLTSNLFLDCCFVSCYPKNNDQVEEELSGKMILHRDDMQNKVGHDFETKGQMEMKHMASSESLTKNEVPMNTDDSFSEISQKCRFEKSDKLKSSHTELFPKCRIKSQQRSCENSSGNEANDGSSLSEACSTPIIGAGSRAGSSHTVIDVDDMDSGLHSGHLATRASLSSLGARSDSMASVYSGAGEGRCCRSVVVTGEVEFALQYDYKHLTFEVHVTKCKNLAPVDVKRKRSDPYVKVYLLPDKSKSGKRKTKVKKHTLNPEFNETLKFHMSLSGLETRTLWLTVWHSDMFGRNDFLGEVRMPLENKIFDDPTPKWYPLQERTEPFDDPVAYKGEVIVGLKFVPPDPTQQERDREIGSDRGVSKSKKNWSRGALHVLVKEARNLQTRAKNSGTCDPFCKSYLLPDKGRSGKQKTGVVRRSGGSPVWGHTFIYKDVSLQELAERGLELTVWDHDRIASNEFLGGVRFNLGTGKHYGKPVDWMDATGRELSLWQNMLERPNFWVEGAVTLRPNLHNHGKNITS
ncbi:Synaptotagmin-like protein 5, partial [Habropoda laboriosa]